MGEGLLGLSLTDSSQDYTLGNRWRRQESKTYGSTSKCYHKLQFTSTGSMDQSDCKDEALLFSPDLQPNRDKWRSSAWSQDSRDRHWGNASPPPFSRGRDLTAKQPRSTSARIVQGSLHQLLQVCLGFTSGKTSRSFHKTLKSNPNPQGKCSSLL